MRKILSLICFVLLGLKGFSQDCTTLGQNPGTAFPVCGTGKFVQNEVPLCGIRNIPTPCPGNIYTDINPFWYKFTAFSGGTLGFIITPNNLSSDYDWQLFDITNAKPEDVYTNSSLFVACNWSGESGITGTTANSTSVNVCGGMGQPIFSKMPTLIEGHQYLLLVSHFTPSQSGYTLEFKGGTASITDPTPPAMVRAEADCIGQRINIFLNKKMRCQSLALDGSDFIISDPSVNIVKATAIQCSSGFDMDYIEIELDKQLNEGTYEIQVKKGSDGNSILDNCENSIPESQKISFQVASKQPTLLDSIVPVTCAPTFIDVLFPKGINCSSVTANGSEFMITGPSLIGISGSIITCENGFTKKIRLELDRPIVTGGTY
ncbi:MAG: gliding motility-associated C-terminal domain-containing protein, partial [Flavitalea sp.]